ncbi:hypothetical protein [Streptomyces colonosanans]|uniref:Uncharacterized protein n=1 Tax=Streptomyces colonosanans TaxID=1428652 RepID=A0A1S2PP90_9ACTN|nr:hypothetical protein [Streptomyces colonosanans]OIJ95412.1 hypothetical protein BIV24_09015 [Streptomyces colonosanans]
MNTEQHTVGQDVGPRNPAMPIALWQPSQPQHHTLEPVTAPAVTLYQVPVPGAVQVQLPDGRIAWGRPVEHRLDPLPAGPQREPMPAWAKAIGMVAGSLTALALGGAIALRIAEPALGGLVDLLDTLWKLGLTLVVILFGAAIVARSLFAKAANHTSTGARSGTASRPGTGQTVVFAPQIDTSGTRLIGRGGDVNIQWGDSNRNKQ